MFIKKIVSKKIIMLITHSTKKNPISLSISLVIPKPIFFNNAIKDFNFPMLITRPTKKISNPELKLRPK